MKTSLLDVLFMSEKRKGVLLLLHEEPREMEFLIRSLETTRQALLPQVRILEKNHLVSHNRDIYELTTIGKLIVGEMEPLLGTIRVLEGNLDYWGRHNLSLIPPHLMERLRELGNCTVLVPSIQEMHEFNREMHERSKESQYFFQVASSFKSDFDLLFSDLVQKGTKMSFIISGELMEYLKKEKYREFKEYMAYERVEFYLHSGEMPFLSFVQNDFCMLFELLTNEGAFDNTQLMYCNPGALEWGRELFEFYRQNSTPIAGI
jgi:predicted transcriptional regulator